MKIDVIKGNDLNVVEEMDIDGIYYHSDLKLGIRFLSVEDRDKFLTACHFLTDLKIGLLEQGKLHVEIELDKERDKDISIFIFKT